MPIDPVDQFWRHVERTEGCWLWTGARMPHGYGNAGTVRLVAAGLLHPSTCRVTSAHRIAYQLHHGRHLAPDEHIDHLCRVRNCVRPDHLEAVSQATNNARTVYNPRNGWGERDACGRGHRYTEATLRWVWDKRRGTVYRACRVCDEENRRRAAERRRSAA